VVIARGHHSWSSLVIITRGHSWFITGDDQPAPQVNVVDINISGHLLLTWITRLI